VQLVLIAVLFLGPLLFAGWMYYGSSGLVPEGRSNHGILLEPVRHLADNHANLREVAPGRWLLVYASDAECDERCRDALFTQQQSRLMLGNDMNRLARVFLHGDTPLDTVFPDEEPGGLITLYRMQLVLDLRSALPRDTAHGGFFLIDPLGNLVMYFEPAMRPRDMVDDIKHLLDLSRIG
jgi:hypothetical protein